MTSILSDCETIAVSIGVPVAMPVAVISGEAVCLSLDSILLVFKSILIIEVIKFGLRLDVTS